MKPADMLELRNAAKRTEVKKQFKQLLESTEKTLNEMLSQALSSGAVPESWFEKDNYLLAKIIIDIWCQQRPYAPLLPETKKEENNLIIYFI